MKAEIISVGTELLLGDIVNSNSQFLSRELAAYGVDTLYQSTVGDNRERLKEAIELALSRCDMVILTGGLGPTEDDLTRETVADYLGLPLVLDEDSDQRIRAYFERAEKEYTENNQKQAMLPEGCTVFRNDHGTAPGCAIEHDGHYVIMLPGPPRELTAMFCEQVAPYLASHSGGTIHSHTVGVYGIPEAAIDERLHDLMESTNPTVAPYAKEGEVVLRVTAKANSEEEANALCDPIIAEIRERLGNAVYGVDVEGLAHRVVSLLSEKGMKIATAESCTAGLLSGRLTEVPGASCVFECGVAAYSKEIKHQVLGVPESILEERGAVSPETAGSMAVGACKVSGADIGIGITGVAGPEPSEGKAVGTVYVALADGKRVWVKKLFAGHGNEDREHIRNVATLYALDIARRYLETLPGVMAGGQSLEQMQQEVMVLAEEKKAIAKKRRRRTMFLRWFSALTVLLLLTVCWGYVYVYLPYRNKKMYDDMYALYTQAKVEEGTFPDGMLTNFMSLYLENKDVRGFVTIADTNIRYPFVEEPSEGYYEKHNFKKATSTFGAPYVRGGTSVKPDTMKSSLTIYGNNPGNGQMFSQLADYTELSVLKQRPLIQMSTIYQESAYKIFAVVLVDDTDKEEYDYARTDFAEEEDFLFHVAQLRVRSLFDTPVDVMYGDQLLMLTTSIKHEYDGARIVVVARRVRADEEEENDLTKARVNRTAKMPKGWIEANGGTVSTTSAEETIGTTAVTELPTTATTAGTTTTTVEQTTTTVASASSTTGAKPSTTTKPPATTTTTTTKPTTTTTPPTTVGGGGTTSETPIPPTTHAVTKPATPATPSVTPSAGTVKGTISEYDFLANFAVKNSGAFNSVKPDADGVTRPKNKEELQLILAAIVKSELGSASAMINSTEAQKAQAVATYTYTLWYNVYYGKPYGVSPKALDLNNKTDKKIYDAVGQVLGVKVINTNQTTINRNMLIQTVYSASTGGYTASSSRVWGGSLAYAKSVVSLYDDASTNAKYGGTKYVSTVKISRDNLYAAVKTWFKNNKPANYTLPEEQFTTNSQNPLRATSYDGDGSMGKGDAWNYVYQTNFYYLDNKGNKKAITGHEMRSILGLRSHAFRTSYDAATQTVVITVQGHGHGVGLSQMGAVGYANEAGWNYVQILRHYYSVTDTSTHQVVTPIW